MEPALELTSSLAVTCIAGSLGIFLDAFYGAAQERKILRAFYYQPFSPARCTHELPLAFYI